MNPYYEAALRHCIARGLYQCCLDCGNFHRVSTIPKSQRNCNDCNSDYAFFVGLHDALCGVRTGWPGAKAAAACYSKNL